MPSLLILIPLVGLMVLNFSSRTAMRRYAFAFACAIFSVQIILAISHHPTFWKNELEKIDAFFRVGLSVDHLSFLMLFAIGIVSMASLLVARYTVVDDRESFKFINLLIVASIGMCGTVIVKDIFSLYVFLEITAIASFILIAFRKDAEALEGSFKYMILSAIATIMILASIALLLLVAGNTSFSAIRTAMEASGQSKIILLALSLFICGLLIKGGLVPFHGWLPDAYSSAPGAVSVLLAGIVTKTAGIYSLIRVVAAVFGFAAPLKSLLLLSGALSIAIGAFAALTQTDMKRLFAYSSISQVGYIVIGFATGSALGIAGAIFHLFNHAIFKSLLFVNTTAIESRLGTTDLRRMGGLSRMMPYTGTTSVIALLSAAGVPPLAGFWSKLMIIIALWQSGNFGYALLAALAGVVTLAYLLTVQRKVFFGITPDALRRTAEAGRGIVLASIVLAAIAIVAGIAFPILYSKLLSPAVRDLLTRQVGL